MLTIIWCKKEGLDFYQNRRNAKVCSDGTARDDCRLASRQLARVGGGSAHIWCTQSVDKYILQLGRPSNTTLWILSVKGGGSTPQIRNTLFAKKKSVKGGRGVPPKSVTYFLDQNQVFFEQKTPFLPPKSVTPSLPEKKSVKGRGNPPYGQNPQSSIWRPPSVKKAQSELSRSKTYSPSSRSRRPANGLCYNSDDHDDNDDRVMLTTQRINFCFQTTFPISTF